MNITHLTPASYTRSPWKNGGGVTVDIAEERLPGSVPGSWEGLVWRLGQTTISTPAPFSDLGGFDRCQVVIAGSGLVLDTPLGEIDLRQPFVPVHYPGEAPISSRLENGPVEVVNLIADRRLVAIRLDILRPGMAMSLPDGACVIHAPHAGAVLRLGPQRHAIAADHALRLGHDMPEGAADGARQAPDHVMHCDEGLLLVASIRPRHIQP
jgi:uncharacterized protein